MTIPAVQNQDAAARAVEANTTPRSRRLSLLRAYVRGDQYAGRKPWFCKDVPVWEREPCVIWMAPESAITSNEDLLLGQGRYPVLSSRPEEDNGDEDELLDEDSSEALDSLLRSIEEQADLCAHNRQQYCNGQSVGSIVGVFGARSGKLFADVADAEFCTWELDGCGDAIRLEIKYPYVDVHKNDQTGAWEARALFFRRVIDTERDVTYLPGVARDDGIEPKWVEDKSKTVAHGLGFCPVVPHKFRSVSSIVSETDGHAIHARVLDELDAFNLEASTRHEGAMYSLPQKYEIGVDPGYNPTGTVPQGMLYDAQQAVPGTAGGGFSNPVDNKATSHYNSPVYRSSLQGSRKQGPGSVWQYANPDVELGQLKLDAGALEALASTMADLRARICEALAWVALNPEEIKFAAALSGKALERLMARQLNRVSKDRDGFGKGYLLKSYCMLLRIAQKTAPGLKLRGLDKAKAALDSFVVTSGELNADGTPRSTWTDPPLSLRWGAWFQPLPDDDLKLVNTVKEALTASPSLITRRTAVEKLSRVFDVGDVNAYLESLEKESKERSELESRMLASGIAKMHAGITNDQDQGGRGEDQEENPGSGGHSASAASPKTKKPAGRFPSRG